MIFNESETVELKESFDREAIVAAGALANTRGGKCTGGSQIAETFLGRISLPGPAK